MKKFIKEFCPQSPSYNKPPETDSNTSSNKNTELEQQFNIQELNIAINSCNSNSSPGLDQINNLMLKNMPENFRLLLLHTLNEIFDTNDFP